MIINIRKKELLYSLFLGVFLFLVLSFDLSIMETGNMLQRILDSLHTYGLYGNVVVIGFTTINYLWLTILLPMIGDHLKALNLLAIVFGLTNTSSLYMFHRDALPISAPGSVLLFLILSLGYVFLFLVLGSAVILLLTTVGEKSRSPSSNDKNNPCKGTRFAVFSFLFILAGWTPWIVSYYPASMEWDVYYPIRQFLGELAPNNQHPWFYACIVGAAYKLGMYWGNKNLGIFIYIIIRALIMAAIYARCIYLQKESGIPFFCCVITLLFYGFTPVWGAYAKHAFKDTVAAAFFCWYVLTTIMLVKRIESNRETAKMAIEHSLAGLSACLFRNNMIYAVAPATISFFLYMFCRKKKIGASILLLIGLIMFEGYQSYIFEFVGIHKGSMKEALSIPLQQTARTVKYHSDTITEEEKVNINAVLKFDELVQVYDPIISDPVKDSWRGTTEEHRQYLLTWAKMFVKYPKTYIEAFIAHSSGYYAFTPEYTEAQRYGPGSHANVGMTIFNWVEDGRFSEDLTCSYSNSAVLEVFRDILNKWSSIWHQIPILNFTDLKPLYTWTILLLGYLLFRKRAYLELIPIATCLIMIMTCVASPVNDCFRYYSPVAAAFPSLFMLTKKISLKEGK